MYKPTVLLICLLLLTSHVNTQCQNSNIRGMASGIINLGLPTNATAPETFSQSLAGANLGLQAEVFHAFAIAGFLASSGQLFYSLVVDTVIFSNGNTLMNFTMSYTQNAGGINFETTWTKVKLSWLAVSTNFYSSITPGVENSLGNLVWAGTYGISDVTTTTTDSAILVNSVFSAQPGTQFADITCGYLNTSPPAFDLDCGAARPNARFMVHPYIMGFRFNPIGGTHTLAASVLLGDGGSTQTRAVDQAFQHGTPAQLDFVFSATTTVPSGPKLTIKAFGTQLRYLKIAIVITTILDMSLYPASTNTAPFVYSGVYMRYTLFNAPKALVQEPLAADFASRATATLANKENINYFGLLNARYQIFGLSSFEILNLPTSVSVVEYDLSFTDLNTMLLNTNNINYISNVRVSADRYNSLLENCTAVATNILAVASKVFTIVPTLEVGRQNIFEVSSALTFNYEATASTTALALSERVLFTNTLTFSGIVPGVAYKILITLNYDVVTAASPFVGYAATLIPTPPVQYTISVQGNVIINSNFVPLTTAGLGQALTTPIPAIGYIFTVTNPTITISINAVRPIETTAVRSLRFLSSTVLTEYSQAYDPIIDCCVRTCPPNSGVNVNSNPPSCIACTAGLIYNTVSRQCQCQVGFYTVTQSVTQQVQCYPCQAVLCQSCAVANPLICTSCVTGAVAGPNNDLAACACTTGFYRTGSSCTTCPIKCATCQTAGVCLTCSDTITRSASPNCVCLDGFFESGGAVCTRCQPLCRTCASSTSCTSCFTDTNRALQFGQCVCATGFYQFTNPDLTVSCLACSPSCTSCSLLPTLCNNCDGPSNRVLGIDSNNQQACVCRTGFIENANRQCVQAGCSLTFCSECQTVLTTNICIRCLADSNRFLALPSQTCQCNSGLYDAAGICTACASGCAVCTSGTTCRQCVASATNGTNGVCNCLGGYFFATIPSRHCRLCPRACSNCTSDTVCSACNTNYILSDRTCTCPNGFFVNNNSQCTPCLNGCQTCNSTTSCIACNLPLLLQETSCVSRCLPGFYQAGFSCMKCSEGCSACNEQYICQICNAGRLEFNGFCPTSCPPGAVANADRTKCLPCNAPCLTCNEHPSQCTSCSACCGSLFNKECLTSCPVGTFSSEGACKFCSFNCASCIGTSNTCTACPVGKILYNGACYDKCPFIMIGGICTFNCAAGLYKNNINQCQRCDSSCRTCQVVPQNCTTCSPGFAHKGRCLSPCPFGFLGLEGICKQCNPECDGCVNNCATCVNCAVGFFKCGSSCCKTCPPNQFVQSSINSCISCNPKCRTCSTQQFCTTCANPQAVPVNGVCNDCSYPCDTCGTAPSICLTCVQGFSLVGSTCITACPTGASPVDGVCQCSVGFIYSNQCVSLCPTRFGPVGGQCVKCSENCAACQGTSTTCTSCLNGFALNAVTGTCDLAPKCQFGQFFSQSSNGCARICPQNTFYYESVCLTNCLQGFQDNGVGGCVAKSSSTGCSHPYYLSNGACVSNCPAATYANSQKRICQSCSSNCFSCLTNTFCYACNAGFDLVNGFCVTTSTTCPAGQFRYNGVCYAACPLGTCSQGGYCQRTCPAGTWSHNSGCYRTCPTKFTTNDACVQTCPAGTTLQNGICQPSAQTCAAGSFFDASSSSCRSCNFPCSACSLTGFYCTACANGLTLNQNLCVSTSSACGAGQFQDANRRCQPCAAKCSTCISATSCSQCATGFTFNGFDCVAAVAKLQKIDISILNVCRRENIAIVSIRLNIIPNGLSPIQRSNFFLIVPSSGDKVSFVNQWQPDSTTVMVAINYAQFPLKSTAYLAINARQLASSYASIGYTADSNSFVSASISTNNANCPSSLVVPASTSAVQITPANELNVQIAKAIELQTGQNLN